MLVHASLFSGIGGFDLAADWMGWDNLFHCEWNPFGQRVLKHHFPNSISYNDITKTDFTIHEGSVDILTGGFPCQPYSTAGKRLGKADERHLFPHMLRCIKEVKPRWVVGENVRGLVNWNGGLVFNEVYDDLEREGYEVQSFLIPAAGVNAPHQRYRIWFVAYSNNYGTSTRFGEVQRENGEISKRNEDAEFSDSSIQYATNTNSRGLEGTIKERWDSQYVKRENGSFTQETNVTNSNTSRIYEQHNTTKSVKQEQFSRVSFERRDFSRFPTKSAICGGNDGIPRELDSITFSKWRNESIKAYGNAIVPQVAYEIFKAIEEFELMVNK
jgi:DNA (cytosine-5)-methyltransferase 1